MNLEIIRSKLAEHEPVLAPFTGSEAAHAAVALILHQPANGGCELLFIKRARHPDDSWSGHIAFPGGHRDRQDPDIVATARREVWEELQVRLEDPLGRLDDLDARKGSRPWPLVVSPFVFALPARPAIRMNREEVWDVRWAPLKRLLHPAAASTHVWGKGPDAETHPAVRFEDFNVWGMTYRMLRNFVSTFGGRLPA
ncbi:MAG: CoA pyrophosphatase [Planctomycetota bacterium]